MFARLLILFYAIVGYAVFLVSFLYAVGFIGNYFVPKSIDVGDSTNLSEATIVDLLLLGLFAVQHSIMARPAFKQWWDKIFPAACQRSTYVLSAPAGLTIGYRRGKRPPSRLTVPVSGNR